MTRTLRIRDVDDEMYAGLARHAAAAGLSVPDLLRLHAARLAARPTTIEWSERTSRRTTDVSRDEVIEALDELRGPWPSAGR